MSIEDRLIKLKIKLPNAPAPVGSYAAFKKVNNLVFISGQISIDENGKILKGKIGQDLKLEDGIKASQICCLNLLAQLKKACDEDLNKVKNCIQIAGYINSTNDFGDQAKVLNGASELLTNIFGEIGIHSRAALSVNSLPLGAAVEIVSIFEINSR